MTKVCLLMLDLIFSVWVQSERGRRGFRGVPFAQDSNVFQRQAEARLEFGHRNKMIVSLLGKRIVWVSGINKAGATAGEDLLHSTDGFGDHVMRLSGLKLAF